jgi:type VI secretion system protein VasJ
MLGSIKLKHSWEWTAMGKHPAAIDYFRLGSNAPLVNAFAGWIENGYQKLLSRNRTGSTFCSWRFWAKDIRKGYIACGVGRDSSDSAGRPYPLMIMGVGTLSGWEENWHLLTFALEDTWKQIEDITSGRFADLKQLETDISMIKLPSRQWSAFADSRLKDDNQDNDHGKNMMPHRSREIEKSTGMLLENHELFVAIDDDQDCNSLTMAGHWMGCLTSRMDIVPNAVFLGGVPEKSYLAIFNRSLNTGDFVRLWSVSDGD